MVATRVQIMLELAKVGSRAARYDGVGVPERRDGELALRRVALALCGLRVTRCTDESSRSGFLSNAIPWTPSTTASSQPSARRQQNPSLLLLLDPGHLSVLVFGHHQQLGSERDLRLPELVSYPSPSLPAPASNAPSSASWPLSTCRSELPLRRGGGVSWRRELGKGGWTTHACQLSCRTGRRT